MNNNPNILIAPLDWGLGHASRCTPIVERLIKLNCNVIIAADNSALDFLKDKFPGLKFIYFRGYNISYSKNFTILKIISQLPKITFKIISEHIRLNSLIKENKINAVISDNRFGLWNKKVYTVFITHQIAIKLPPALKFFEKLLYKINIYFIEKFDECWIPDFIGTPNLTGDLSHKRKPPRNARFINPLSRFKLGQLKQPENFIYDILIVLSGPEPQRTLLEDKILSQLKSSPFKACVVRGLPDKKTTTDITPRIRMISFANDEKLLRLLSVSKMLISRAGYSTIMDLVTLRKPAILIPTPGQTEQEYLARHLAKSKVFLFVQQNNFSIEKHLNALSPSEFPFESDNKKLEAILDEFLKKLRP